MSGELEETVAELLRRAVDAEMAAVAPNLAEVRAALDAYERVLRSAAEAAVASKVMAALGEGPPERPDVGVAAGTLSDALRQLLARIEPAVEAPATAVTSEQAREPAAELAPPADAPEVAAGEPAIVEPHEEEALETANVAPPPAERPSGLTQSQIDEWIAANSAPPPTPAPQRAGPERELTVLRGLLHRVGEAPDLTTSVGAVEELDRLDAVTEEAQIERWFQLSRDTQWLWLSLVVARARAVRDTIAHEPALRRRHHAIIIRLPAFSKKAQPGFVNGMQPAHRSKTQSWTSDAEHLLAELRALAYPKPVVIEPVPEEPAPSRKVRVKGHAKTDDEPREHLPADWSLRDRVGTMRAVIFGGAPREDARESLETAFGFKELEWPESDKPRKVDALSASIRGGNVDLLIALTSLMSHKDFAKLNAVARATGTPVAMVQSGYGVEALREAIEGALLKEAARA